MSEADYLGGKFLLAMPGMGDPRFDRAVIALCVHNENGAFGIGIGDTLAGVGLHSILTELDIDPGVAPDCPVHQGGPVEPGRGFVLHSPDWHDDQALPVSDLFSLSASLDILRAIAEGRGPARWLIALGYAGWAPGQLDEEMQRHGWFAGSASEGVLFNTASEKRWNAAWRAEGIDPALLASETGRA